METVAVASSWHGYRCAKAADGTSLSYLIPTGMRVLDVAAGTGNAALRAAAAGAEVVASELTPPAAGGRTRTRRGGRVGPAVAGGGRRAPAVRGRIVRCGDVLDRGDVRPHHQVAADELVRVCRPGGTIGLLSWTPEGMIGDLFRTMGPFAAPPPPGASPAPLWGSEEHLTELFGDRVDLSTQRRENLEITAFSQAREYGEHFKACYGPTIAVRANAERNGRAEEFDAALDAFCDRWNLSAAGPARSRRNTCCRWAYGADSPPPRNIRISRAENATRATRTTARTADRPPDATGAP